MSALCYLIINFIQFKNIRRSFTFHSHSHSTMLAGQIAPRLRLGFASATSRLRLDYALASISCEHCCSSRNSSHCAPSYVIYYFKIFQKRIIRIRNFFPDNYSSFKIKHIDLLFIKKSKYVLNFRALKFQYVLGTFFQFFENISKTVIDIAEVRRYSQTALNNASN